MNEQLKTLMESTIDTALKAGADSADLILNTGESFSLSAQSGDIDKYQVSGSKIMGIRVIKDQKVGISYSESLEPEELENMAKAAVENSRFSDINEFESIHVKADKPLITIVPAEDDGSSTQDKIDFCLRLEKEVRDRDSRVQAVPYNGYSEGRSETYYLNSLGTFGYDSEGYSSCYTSALVAQDGKTSMHYHGVMARNLSKLDLNACVDESLEHAVNWLEAGPVKTGNYDVVFVPDALVDVFGCFGNIFSAKAAWDKLNPFAEKLGTKVAVDGLTIVDVPRYKDAFFRYDYDSEGVERSDLTLIENGILKSFYHNTATANYFKTKTTGHGSRGPKSSLGVGGTNKLISVGTAPESDVTSGTYLEVHSLQGLHSGSNAITGDFSFGASGYLCRDGKRVQPVNGITIAGNFHKMLLNISTMGNTLHSNEYRSFFAPKIKFSNLSIAGN